MRQTDTVRMVRNMWITVLIFVSSSPKAAWQTGQRATGISVSFRIESPRPNNLWDSRPLTLSTMCHFLFGIHRSGKSLPIVPAKQPPTQPFLFVHDYFCGLMVSPVHCGVKMFGFLFPFCLNLKHLDARQLAMMCLFSTD